LRFQKEDTIDMEDLTGESDDFTPPEVDEPVKLPTFTETAQDKNRESITKAMRRYTKGVVSSRPQLLRNSLVKLFTDLKVKKVVDPKKVYRMTNLEKTQLKGLFKELSDVAELSGNIAKTTLDARRKKVEEFIYQKTEHFSPTLVDDLIAEGAGEYFGSGSLTHLGLLLHNGATFYSLGIGPINAT